MRKSKRTMRGDHIVPTMIKLARCTNLHRIIMSGPAAPERIFELQRLGYSRVATTATCGLPRGQYDVALVDWQLRSISALETTLNWLVHFLTPAGVLVVGLAFNKYSDQRTLKSIFERLGFQIEAGVRCEDGVAISARRLEAQIALPRVA
ncbi:MAG TPA: hypothetical protein VKP67_23770 [Xanthobacteraceae bacterium]|nr:hypothetical protein [Xanthobacteraceae bacterium]